jgi:UDP-N-acetylmuramoyl-tripeptide--D-alanyl-D-alanine ligase
MLLLRGPLEQAPGGAAERSWPACNSTPLAFHPDPRRALCDLAAWHRSRLSIPVIGITGSCGKTTVKNILVALLEPMLRVVGSPSSFNNDVGVPHTLLLADERTQVLVVEMGTNRPGEIAALARIARPTAGIVTNVGASHLEGLQSIEGVALEKSELFAALPREGFAVLNTDCRWADVLRVAGSARLLTYSVEGDGEFNATDPWFHEGGTTFRLFGREITSPLLGTHNIHNLLAALACCHGLSIPLDDVLPGVSRLRGGRQRMERIEVGQLTVFDDSYNANPESAKAGVRVLCGLHGHLRRVLVLGDMLELGARAPELHYAIGHEAAARGVDVVICVGELSRAAAAGALEGGIPVENVVHVDDASAAAELVPMLLRDGDVVLVKGSRRMELERLVQRLRALGHLWTRTCPAPSTSPSFAP